MCLGRTKGNILSVPSAYENDATFMQVISPVSASEHVPGPLAQGNVAGRPSKRTRSLSDVIGGELHEGKTLKRRVKVSD